MLGIHHGRDDDHLGQLLIVGVQGVVVVDGLVTGIQRRPQGTLVFLQALSRIADQKAITAAQSITNRWSCIRRFYHLEVDWPAMFASPVLDGQVAIVTGGGTGIGLAIGRSLGALGAKVVVASRGRAHLDEGEAALREDGCETMTVEVDVRDPSQVQAMVDQVVDRLSRMLRRQRKRRRDHQAPPLAEGIQGE